MIGGVETHVLFDTGATHSFVSPELVGKGLFCLDSEGGRWASHELTRSHVKYPSVNTGKGIPCGFGLCPPKESRNDPRYGLVGKVSGHSRLP